VECERCGRTIAYDPRTSRWIDESGVPGCAPADDGQVLGHLPKWTDEMREKLSQPEEDPLELYSRRPSDQEPET